MIYRHCLLVAFLLVQWKLLFGAVQQSLPALPNACRPAALSSADADKDGVPDLVVRCENFQKDLYYLYRGKADSFQYANWSLPFDSEAVPVQKPGTKESQEIKMFLNSDAVLDKISIAHGGQIVLELSTPAVTFTVNSTSDPGNGICDAGECTLREAIIAANATMDPDLIQFNLPGPPFTIAPTTALPTITSQLSIDGTTQPGYNGSPVVELSGSNLSGFFNGLDANSAGVFIRGIVINRFEGSAINLSGAAINIVDGNFIGTDITGTIDLGNGSCGIQISNSSNIIGTLLAPGRNVISGNKAGICIFGNDSDNNVIYDNFIGITADGNSTLGNDQHGILIQDADGTIIGASGVGNVISGNSAQGSWPALLISNGSQTQIQGNFIGTNASGDSDLGNAGHGMLISGGSDNTIAQNVISGNDGNGIFILDQSQNNEIWGNSIGTDLTGAAVIGNGGGISLFEASGTVVGGTTSSDEGNVISGNGSGIGIEGGSANSIQGNWIGTDQSGTLNLGNTDHGIQINNSSQNIVRYNVVAYNPSGIKVTTSSDPCVGNLISSNSIFANGSGWPSIDLGNDLVTFNDAGDGDSGPNNLQNFPELTSFSSDSASTSVQGTLNSGPNSQYKVEFFSSPSCHTTNHGPGKTPLGTTTVTTDASGNVSFDAASLDPMPSGEAFLTATATNLATNDTSEYSACISNQAGLLFDDFEDNVLTWNAVKGSWGESAGSLIGTFEKSAAYAPLPWPVSGLSGCTTCTIEADVFTEGGKFGRLFIAAWFQNSKTKVELVMKEESNKCILKEKVNRVLTNKAKAECPLIPHVTNHVVISFNGTNYQVTIDGQLLITMPAAATPFGNVGFRSKNTKAWIQQIFVQ